MSKNMSNNHNSKSTSSCRIKYTFNLLVEECVDGVLQPQQRISMSADCEVTEIKTAVRQLVKGAVQGLADGLGGDDEDQAPVEEQPEDNPEQTEE